jgi:hypothetical protein
MKYPATAAHRSAGLNGLIERPQPGQNAAPAGIELSQREQTVSAGAGLDELYESTAIASLPALFANAVDLKSMSSGYKMMFASNLLFELSHFRREKLHRGAALRTHHVMMTAPVVLMLVAGDAIMKRDFAGQAAVSQQFERPVYGGESDVRVFFLYELTEFVGRKMLARLEERPQNGSALLRLLQANAPQMPQKNTLGLAHVLRRDAGLIVNSFLQHG